MLIKSNSTNRICCSVKNWRWSKCQWVSVDVFSNNFRKKIKEIRLKFYQGSVTVLWKMVNHQKKIQDKKLPHELFLTTRQATKKRISIARNGLADIKLSKA